LKGGTWLLQAPLQQLELKEALDQRKRSLYNVSQKAERSAKVWKRRIDDLDEATWIEGLRDEWVGTDHVAKRSQRRCQIALARSKVADIDAYAPAQWIQPEGTRKMTFCHL